MPPELMVYADYRSGPSVASWQHVGFVHFACDFSNVLCFCTGENKMLEGPVRDPSELGAVELATIISE